MGKCKIAIYGPNQCGSTRLFNLVRLVYEAMGLDVHSAWLRGGQKKCDVTVIKSHRTIPCSRGCIALLPHRDTRDSTISWIARRWSKGYRKGIPSGESNKLLTARNHMKSQVRRFYQGVKRADYLFRYESYDADYVERLCNFLNETGHYEVKLSGDGILDIMNELDDMHTSKDIVKTDMGYKRSIAIRNPNYKKTLLSQNHNTAGGKSKKYETYFTEEQNKFILDDKLILKYLTEYGYV
jgi:hypothetical protein